MKKQILYLTVAVVLVALVVMPVSAIPAIDHGKGTDERDYWVEGYHHVLSDEYKSFWIDRGDGVVKYDVVGTLITQIYDSTGALVYEDSTKYTNVYNFQSTANVFILVQKVTVPEEYGGGDYLHGLTYANGEFRFDLYKEF
jgi:hypothetical protein